MSQIEPIIITPTNPEPGPRTTSWLRDNAHWVALLGGLFPALAASTVSVLTAIRGEPTANRAYETLVPQVNGQRVRLLALEKTVIAYEARIEGWKAAQLHLQIRQLRAANRTLQTKVSLLLWKGKKAGAGGAAPKMMGNDPIKMLLDKMKPTSRQRPAPSLKALPVRLKPPT